MNIKLEYVSVNELVPYDKNTRLHEDYDVSQIAKSIEKYGFNDPIGVWKGNVIIEGHGRLEAAKTLGLKEVPIIRLDHLTDKERREYAIMHNKTAELSKWDFDALGKELLDIDLSGFNVDFNFQLNLNPSEVSEAPKPSASTVNATNFAEIFEDAEEMLPDEYDKSIEQEYGEAVLPATVFYISTTSPEAVQFIKSLIREEKDLRKFYTGEEIMERYHNEK